jgi:hypothetical protein
MSHLLSISSFYRYWFLPLTIDNPVLLLSPRCQSLIVDVAPINDVALMHHSILHARFIRNLITDQTSLFSICALVPFDIILSLYFSGSSGFVRKAFLIPDLSASSFAIKISQTLCISIRLFVIATFTLWSQNRTTLLLFDFEAMSDSSTVLFTSANNYAARAIL